MEVPTSRKVRPTTLVIAALFAVSAVAVMAVTASGSESLAEARGYEPVAHEGEVVGYASQGDLYSELPGPEVIGRYADQYERDHGERPGGENGPIWPPPEEGDVPVYAETGEHVGYLVPILGYMTVEEFEAYDFDGFYDDRRVVEQEERAAEQRRMAEERSEQGGGNSGQ